MAGSTSAETHFRVLITSESFKGKMQPARHRMVYALLKDEMAKEGGIHALQLRTKTAEEDERAARKEKEEAEGKTDTGIAIEWSLAFKGNDSTVHTTSQVIAPVVSYRKKFIEHDTPPDGISTSKPQFRSAASRRISFYEIHLKQNTSPVSFISTASSAFLAFLRVYQQITFFLFASSTFPFSTTSTPSSNTDIEWPIKQHQIQNLFGRVCLQTPPDSTNGQKWYWAKYYARTEIRMFHKSFSLAKRGCKEEYYQWTPQHDRGGEMEDGEKRIVACSDPCMSWSENCEEGWGPASCSTAQQRTVTYPLG